MTGTVSYKRVRNSCLKCRHRKIRCTRERPQCYNCLRLSHVCQYESPPPQAVHVQPHLYVAQGYGQPRLPPAPANGRPQQQDSDGWQNGSPTAASAAAAEQQHIRRRLGELEHAVAQLLSVVPIGSATAQAASDDSARDMIRSISRVSDQLGSLITEVDGEPRYRSASHWGQMIEDGLVSGLDGESATASLPLLLFSPDDAFDPAAYLPSRHEAYWLYSTFCSKVDPIVRIIHKPSFEQDMDKYFGALGDERTVPNPPVGEGSSWVKAGFEALLFAVLYSAVFSLEDEGFWQYTQQRGNAEQNQTQFYADGQGVESNLAHVRRSRLACLETYRYACCQCLLRSQIFEKQSLPSVTALFLLSFMAFHETGVPSLYTIVGLLIRISRSFGLHIDPEVLASRNRGPASARPQLDGVPSGLAPALMEIRRRLWHQIIHLDLMASEARGIDPDNGYVSDLWPGGVGCSLPGNYDDDELAAAAHEHVLPAVPRDRGRHTDMSLQLVRFNASSCLRKLISLNSLRVRGGCLEHNCEIEAAIEGMVETNQTLHLQYCTDTEQGPYLTLMLGKMCACRARLHQYLFCNKRPSSSRSENGGQWSLLRRRALENATELQSLFNTAVTNPILAPFVWHIRRHNQLHAALHILNELSSTRPDSLTDQDQVRQACQAAWEAVEKMPFVSANPSLPDQQNEQDQQDQQHQTSAAVFRVLGQLRDAARRYWSPDSAEEASREYSADSTCEIGQNILDPFSFAALDPSSDPTWNIQAWPGDFGLGNPLFNAYNQ